MKSGFIASTALSIALAALASAGPARAASADQETTFVAAYKKAFEAKDTKTLEGFLYSKGSDPEVLEFFKEMQSVDAGAKITSIELVALSEAELKKAVEPQEGPGGKLVLAVKPSKKLVVKTVTEEGDNHSTSSSEVFVAEVDGKLVIPVPVPAK